MKRKFTFLMAAFMLLAFLAIPLGMRGQKVTLDFTSNDCWGFPTTKTVDANDYTCGGYTITLQGTTGNGYQWYSSGSYLLNGKSGATITLPAFSFDVDKIVVTGRTGASGSVKQNIFVGTTAVSTETTGATGTNTYNIATGYQTAGNVYVLKVTSAHNTQVTKIEIFEKVATAVATPAFNPIEGTYFEAQDVEIACETSGATLQYKLTENGAWQTYTSAIHVTETTTIWAKATLGEKTSEATATYTIPTLITMAAAHELEDNAYGYVQGVVTFIDGRNVFAQDGTGGICLFLNDGTVPDGLAIGDLVRAYGQKTVYNGLIELKNIDGNSSAFTTVSTGNDLPLAVKTISEILTGASDELQSTRVKIENAVIGTINTSGNTPLTQDDNSINIYKVPELTDIQATNYVNVIGVIGYYNNPQVRVASADDVEKVVISTPTITVSTNTLNNFTYVAGSGPSDAQSFTVSGSNLSADITISLGNNSNFEISTSENSGYDNSLTLNQYEGTVSATLVYVRMKSDLSTGGYDDDIEITSGSVTPETINLSGTVTAPEAPNVTWNLAIASYDADPDETLVTWSSAYATMTNEKGTSSTAANNYLGGDSNNRTSTRFYNGQVLTIAPVAGYAITSVVFTATTNSYAKALKNSSWTNASASMEDETNGTTVTVTPTTGTSDISATIGGTCGFTEVKVYYETATVAPVWSTLPTPAINTNSNYMLDLSDYVTGSPTPTIALTSTTATSGYVFDADILDFTPTANGTYTFTFTATNSEGSAQATLTITVTTVHDVYFYVNNEEGGERQVGHGEAIGALPVPTANIPTGFTFVGWMESLPQSDPYYNATTAPTLVEATDLVYGDMILEAVFCIATTEGTWSLSDAAPVAGENVILATLSSGTYYAFFANGSSASATAMSVVNDVITNAPETVWTASDGSATQNQNNYTGIGFSRDGVTGYLHFNNSAIKVAGTYGNGLFDFTSIQGTPNAFTMYGKMNGRYLTYDDSFGVSDNVVDACPVYVFKYVACNTTYCDYTTLVVNHADQTFIAETAAETLYGIHYINGEVAAVYDLTNSGKLIVNNSGVLEVDDVTFSNATAANLVIEEGGQLVANNAVSGTMHKSVSHYTGDKDNYYLIASPIDNFAPNGDMIANNFDLYYFDESKAQEEWRNYEVNNFNLGIGKGYLYANDTDTGLEFAGELTYTTDAISLANTSGKPFAGWNLIGNPYPCRVTINAPFYRISGNALATEATANTVAIEPMEAVFVQYDAANSITSITFTKAPETAVKGNRNALNIMARDNARQTTDNALICFGTGNSLHKFTLNPENAMVFIPQHGEEFAIVDSEARGEMPVNFKAAENGTYTIDVEAENLEVNYLHLIDNLTGMDVDLLATPSYTFEARKSDIASRFRLVFDANTGNDETNDNFAFINNGELIVNGNGTVQVIDILGRQMFSHEVNSAFRIQNSEFAPGVYVLRLVNGNDVKTQKIVIK